MEIEEFEQSAVKIGIGAGVVKHLRDFEGEWGLNILRSPAEFITVGSITRHARVGNPEPRYYFDQDSRTSWNSVGLRGDGFKVFLRQLPKLKMLCDAHHKELRLSISPIETHEIRSMIRDDLSWLPENCSIALLEINAACPNLWGHGVIARDERALKNLLEEVCEESINFPIGLKIAPDTDIEMLKRIIDLAQIYNVSALVSGNTRLVDTPNDEQKIPRIGMPKCGMAGASILESGIRQIEALAEIRSAAASNVRLIACGGIMSGNDLRRYIDVGADEAQLVTAALEYGGKIFQDVQMELYA